MRTRPASRDAGAPASTTVSVTVTGSRAGGGDAEDVEVGADTGIGVRDKPSYLTYFVTSLPFADP